MRRRYCWTYYHMFFFKRSAVYDVRIRDWSSAVCSSGLRAAIAFSVPGTRWPLDGTRFSNYYLDSTKGPGLKPDGRLATTNAAGSELDSYVYDPATPVPTRGGGGCGDDMAIDQRDIEVRGDVLS